MTSPSGRFNGPVRKSCQWHAEYVPVEPNEAFLEIQLPLWHSPCAVQNPCELPHPRWLHGWAEISRSPPFTRFGLGLLGLAAPMPTSASLLQMYNRSGRNLPKKSVIASIPVANNRKSTFMSFEYARAPDCAQLFGVPGFKSNQMKTKARNRRQYPRQAPTLRHVR